MSRQKADNEIYDRHFSHLVALHGQADPRASAYRFTALFERQRDFVLAQIGDAPGRFCDLACGVGLISQPLVQKGIPVLAVDFNAAACAAAATAGLIVCRGDAMRLPFANDSFDTVLVSELIQQLPSEYLDDVVLEACRIAAPGGRVLFVWRNGRSFLHQIAAPVFALLDRLRGKAPVRLFTPTPDIVADAARPTGSTVSDSMTFLSLTRQVFRAADTNFARLAGTTYLLLLTKPVRTVVR